VDITTGRIVGSEALVRWQHPQRGLIPPNDFIPLAEETGLITAIGMWVLDQACRQNHQWHAEGFHDLTVAVNLSARQFNDPNLQREIFEVLRTSEFDPHALELEITESLSMYDVDSSIATMEAFSAKGISIAIDDFGTGFSSLSHLQLFPINKLKIDRSFISKIGDGTKNNLVRTIVTLAKQLELKVIAEGVETSEQLEFLRQLECNLVQGFYFGKPLPPDEFKLLLRQQPKAPLNQRR
jgi:EAL domain-containing protein (putative c-di-GMP-specific phosphodiesterase class I)